MEAKDTVMNKKQLSAINDSMPADAKYGDVFAEIAKQQDKVSVKAGIKKMVEWIVTNAPEGYDQRGDEPPLNLLYIDKELLQEFLKSEGIE